MLTVTGPPGTGKTRLALEVASRLGADAADDSYFVDLSQVSDASLVPHSIATALGIREAGRQSLMQSIKAFLRERETILVLDNFEQVLNAATYVAELLAACPELRIIATSRAPLRIRWEQEYLLHPLELPDLGRDASVDDLLAVPSVSLFMERAQALRPDFRLTADNASTIAEVCVRLDGLPLALELAAGRVRSMSPQSLLERLASRLDLLADGPRDLPERQRTLRTAIGWSYSLLPPPERALFRRLSVFVGGFDLEATRGVIERGDGLDVTVEDSLDRLVDASLIHAELLPSGGTRFRLLETLREYGAECLEAARERRAGCRAHAAYFTRLALAGEQCQTGAEQAAWIARMERDHANVLAALSWLQETGDWRVAASMASVLWRFWWRRGHLSLGRRLVHQILTLPGLQLRGPEGAGALVSAGLLALWQGDYAESQALLLEAVNIAREGGMSARLAYALTFLCRAKRDQGSDGAATVGHEAARLFRETEDRWGLGVALHFLGLALLHDGSADAAPCFEESAAVFKEIESDWDLAMPVRGLGLVEYLRGGHDRARACFEQSAALFRSGGDDWSLAMLSHDLGYVAHSQGRREEAAALLAESLRTWRMLGNTRGMLTALAGLSAVAVESHPALAARLCAAVTRIQADDGVVLEPNDEAGLEQVREMVAARPADGGVVESPPMDMDAVVDAGFEIETLVSTRPDLRGSGRTSPLTRRELEVASLLRLGLTNRQIAERLVISEGTAGLHVKHIIGKLNFTSRAQVAAWAVEHGLEAPSREA
jgi:non-specific serine/threonine protein kinase